MSQQVNLKSRGLFTYDNQLSSIPEGALLEATNVLINRLNTVELRRGFKIYGNSFGTINDVSKQLMNYKNRILRHYNDKIQFDNGSGVFSSFSGSFLEPETNIRIKSLETNGNLLFTSSTGIKKISALTASDFSTAADYIIDAGAPKALEITTKVNYDDAGFFNANSALSYRVLWGYKDANNNLIIGYPSPRSIVYNTSTTDSAIANVNITIPPNITVNHFYQVYRTAMIEKTIGLELEDVDPGDEHYLVFEGNPTSSEILTGEVVYIDQTPDTFRQSGTLLYTNPVSGQGIQQANDIPPLAKDISLFKNCAFYSNTKTRHRLNLSLLSISDFSNQKDINSISIANPTIITTTSNHELETDDVVYLTNTDSTPILSGQYTITKINATQFSVDVNVTSSGTTGKMVQCPQIIISDGDQSFEYTFRGLEEKTDITCIASASLPASPNFGYILINAPSNSRKYYFWFDTTALSDGEAPINVDTLGRIAVKVSVPPAYTDVDVAQAFVAELNSVGLGYGDFSASNVGNLVSIIHNFNGSTDDISEGTYATGFTISKLQDGIGEDYPNSISLLSSISSVSQQVDETARSLVASINRQTSEVTNAFYQSGLDDVPGQILLEGESIVDTEFYVAALTDRIKDNFTPILPRATFINNITTGSPIITITTNNSHGLVTGDNVVITNTTSTPSIRGVHTATVTGLNTFTITIASNLVSASNEGVCFKKLVFSDNEEAPNRLYYSKQQQPEAVPELNYFNLGRKDKSILRILPLRDSLIVLKQDGVYRISGENPSNFFYALFDENTVCISPDSAVTLNNEIYFLSDNGISKISESGVSVISRPIEDVVLELTSNTYVDQYYKSFGISYESDRAYLLFLNDSITEDSATVCYRYNIFTESWTVFDIGKTCGIVGSADDKMYLGANDTNFIEVERKDFSRTDYADREFSLNLNNNFVDSDTQFEISSAANIEIGDVIEQTQYVTISEFNRLLKKLDLDPALDDSDYYSTLGMEAGDNLSSKLTLLIAKLNIDDTSTTYTFSGSSNFVIIQNEFNNLIGDLNTSTGIFYTDYQESNNTKKFECIVRAVNKAQNIITSDFIPPFIVGAVIAYKAIASSVVWSPQFLSNPTSYKHFREGTFLFLSQSFNGCTISYKSDLSDNFEKIEVTGFGNGVWGAFNWGEVVWGGAGNQVPIRTLIPKNKQRCRYLFCKFEHKIARDKYHILGVSLVGEEYSPKAYK